PPAPRSSARRRCGASSPSAATPSSSTAPPPPSSSPSSTPTRVLAAEAEHRPRRDVLIRWGSVPQPLPEPNGRSAVAAGTSEPLDPFCDVGGGEPGGVEALPRVAGQGTETPEQRGERRALRVPAAVDLVPAQRH